MKDVSEILSSLGLKELNPGVWSAKSGWAKGEGKTLDSFNPATGKKIAAVHLASEADYEKVISEARAAFENWREVPAPKRGELVRLIADELRKHKDALGSLVTLEVGKIKTEGDGEVHCFAGLAQSTPIGIPRISDISRVIFTAGSNPPMPGLAPWLSFNSIARTGFASIVSRNRLKSNLPSSSRHPK